MQGDPDHPICPVMLGDAKLASAFADEMLHRGIYVIGFSYPVVPKGKKHNIVWLGLYREKKQVNSVLTLIV